MNYEFDPSVMSITSALNTVDFSSARLLSQSTATDKVYLQTPKRKIDVDTVLTKEDLATNKQLAYQAIYEALISEIPEKADEYKTLCKLYNCNYRTVVLLIESENLKNEHKQLQGALKDDF